MRHYVRATKLAGLEKIAPREGDLHSLMGQVGLNARVLKQPENIIDYSQFCALLSLCAETWSMPDIAFRMIEHQSIDFLGPVALVTRMQGTVRNAVHAIIANLVIHSNVTIATLEEDADVATLVLNQRDMAPQLPENSELVLAQGKLVMDTIAGPSMKLLEVTLVHAQSASASALERYFGCAARYGAERNAVSFDRALLDRRLERTDQAYHALISRYLETERDRIDASFAELVSAEISRQMELGHCTLSSVAMAMQVEAHTMQRRLRAEGSSFRKLMDEWRRNRASSLLLHTRLPLADVSDALGYSDQSVFSQAFRRWFGQTPHHYRAKEFAA